MGSRLLTAYSDGQLVPSVLARLTEPVVNRWPVTLFAPLSGSLAARDRNGALSLVGTGALRWQPAPGAGRNYEQVIGYEFAGSNDAPLYGGYLQNVTFTWPAGNQRSGSRSAQVAVTATGAVTVELLALGQATTPPFRAGTPWRYAAWVRGNAQASGKNATFQFHVRRLDYIGAQMLTTSVITLTADWQRVVLDAVIPPAATRGSIWLDMTGAAAGDVIWADDQVLTPLPEGDTGTGIHVTPWGQLASPPYAPFYSRVLAWVEEATVNQVPDPVFLGSFASNWQGVNGAVASQVPGDGFFPFNSPVMAKIVADGTVAGQGLGMSTALAFAVAPGQTWTVQAALRAPYNQTPVVVLQLVGLDAANGVTETLTSAPVTVDDTTIRPPLPAYTATFAHPNTVKAIPRVVTAAASAQTFYVGYLGCEQKPYATSPCVGSMGTGYSWAGPGHASASSRSSTYVTIPNAGHLDSTMNGGFSLSFWFAPLWTPGSAFNAWVANSGANEAAGPALRVLPDGRVSLAPRGDGSGAVTTAAAIPLAEIHHYAATWDGTTWRVYLDGTLIGQSTGFAPSPGLDANSEIRHGLWGPVAFYRGVLTGETIARLAGLGPLGVRYDSVRAA